jgi:hypothetical protein
MPKRSVYIRPADERVWERAAALAPDGLSRFLTDAIRLYLERNSTVSTAPAPAITSGLLSGLSAVSADAMLERCAIAAAVTGLNAAADIVKDARPETAVRLRALASEVLAW